MTKRLKSRSGCPLNCALEVFGDHWTLLILRDLILMGRRTFKEFQGSNEGIASNILSARIKMLQQRGLITSERSKADKRALYYKPTQKALSLLPTMIEMMIWAYRHENTCAPADLIKKLLTDRENFIKEINSRFDS